MIALHHGSLDQQVREWVERGLKNGLLKVVVCTSSLDLGVDFLPVEQVFQIGSPKGVARLMRRAGRSGHAPGLPSRVTIVPTHALELIEAAAAREAVDKQQIESRDTPQCRSTCWCSTLSPLRSAVASTRSSCTMNFCIPMHIVI
ncbi:Lhr-like helicase [Paraburkholderia sp. MM5496-R1]